jgi:hypothetical protein
MPPHPPIGTAPMCLSDVEDSTNGAPCANRTRILDCRLNENFIRGAGHWFRFDLLQSVARPSPAPRRPRDHGSLRRESLARSGSEVDRRFVAGDAGRGKRTTRANSGSKGRVAALCHPLAAGPMPDAARPALRGRRASWVDNSGSGQPIPWAPDAGVWKPAGLLPPGTTEPDLRTPSSEPPPQEHRLS